MPLYRYEAPIYASMIGMVRTLGMTTLATFHERNGDQDLVRGDGQANRAWGRIFGEHVKEGSPGTVDSTFSGYAGGVQLGIDALRLRSDSGHEDAAGGFFAFGQSRGDVNGFAVGVEGAYAGSTQLNGTSLGAYWTHLGPGAWYLDGVAMVMFPDGSGTSQNNVGVDVDGTSFLASLEGGVPFVLGGGVTLEPQAQLVYQYLDLDNTADRFSTVSFSTPDVLTGRIGARLVADFGGAQQLRSYLKLNLWQDWTGTDYTTYANAHTLNSEYGSTALEAGGGIVMQVTDGVGLWGTAGYTTEVGGANLEVISGNAGVNVVW